MDDNRLQAEDEYEQYLKKEWNFAVNTPMQLASHAFRSGYRAAEKSGAVANEPPTPAARWPVKQ